MILLMQSDSEYYISLNYHTNEYNDVTHLRNYLTHVQLITGRRPRLSKYVET